MAFIPWLVILKETEDDEESHFIRNLLTFKMLRIFRMGMHFFPENQIVEFIASFYEPDGRLARIA